MEKDCWKMTYQEMINKQVVKDRVAARRLVRESLSQINVQERINDFLSLERIYFESSADFQILVADYFSTILQNYDPEKMSRLYRLSRVPAVKIVIVVLFNEKMQEIEDAEKLIYFHETCHSDFDFILEKRLKVILESKTKEEISLLKKRKDHRDWQHILD